MHQNTTQGSSPVVSFLRAICRTLSIRANHYYRKPDHFYTCGILFLFLFIALIPMLPFFGWTFLHSIAILSLWFSFSFAKLVDIGRRIARTARTPIGAVLVAVVFTIVIWLSHLISSHLIADAVGDNAAELPYAHTLITVAVGAAIIAIALVFYCLMSFFRSSTWSNLFARPEEVITNQQNVFGSFFFLAAVSAGLYLLFTRFLADDPSFRSAIVMCDYHANHPFKNVPTGAPVAYLADRISYAVTDDELGWRFVSIAPSLERDSNAEY